MYARITYSDTFLFANTTKMLLRIIFLKNEKTNVGSSSLTFVKQLQLYTRNVLAKNVLLCASLPRFAVVDSVRLRFDSVIKTNCLYGSDDSY